MYTYALYIQSINVKHQPENRYIKRKHYERGHQAEISSFYSLITLHTNKTKRKEEKTNKSKF